MCETLTLAPMRDAAGDARYRKLVQDVNADLVAGNFDLRNVLKEWRDEVVHRLSSLRPQAFRIPQIFVDHLGLRSQKVIMNPDGSVHERLGGNAKRGFVYGHQVVPAAA